jgi:hypothetical protein
VAEADAELVRLGPQRRHRALHLLGDLCDRRPLLRVRLESFDVVARVPRRPTDLLFFELGTQTPRWETNKSAPTLAGGKTFQGQCAKFEGPNPSRGNPDRPMGGASRGTAEIADPVDCGGSFLVDRNLAFPVIVPQDNDPFHTR